MDVLIANLKVLATVPAGGRLVVRRGQLSVDTAVRGQCLIRFWNGDSRENTTQLIKNTANGAMRATEAIMTAAAGMREPPTGHRATKDTWTLHHVARELGTADFGLSNLCATYADDAGTVAALEVISERMRAHGEVIRRFLETGALTPPEPVVTKARDEAEPSPSPRMRPS